MGKGIDFLIDFKLHRSQVTELLAIYGCFLTSCEYADPYERLLSEHIKDCYLRLSHIDATMTKTAKLRFNNSEAVAFYDFWSVTDTSRWPLANVIICDMVQKIDKRIKTPKTYAR